MHPFVDIQAIAQRFAKRCPQADSIIGSCRYYFADGSISNATGRIIDDTLERFFVIRIHHQTKISNNVFYLLSLVERKSAVNLIRHRPLPKSFFKNTALRVRTIQDSKIRIAIGMFATQFGYLIRHNITLFHIAVCLEHTDSFPFLFLGEYGFPYLTLILLNQAVGSTDNGLCGAVILLQFKDFCIRIDFRKIKDIVNIRSTERIDALCIIPYDTNTLVLFGELQNDAVLGIVGILIFVYEHITELLPIAGKHIRKITEQNVGIYQQIIKIHSSRLAAPFPIAGIDVTDSGHLSRHIAFIRFLIGSIACRSDQMILSIGDAGLHSPRLIGLFVKPHFFDDGTEQALTIGSIINGKLGSKSDILRFGTKDSGEYGMESPHPQITCPLHTYLAGNTLFHLTRRLIGKGQREDVPRIVTVLQQIGDFISQHARLPRTCTGYHQ